MAKKKDDVIDFGTIELSKHHTIVPRLTRGNYGFNAKVMDETEIDCLLLEEVIDANEHSTLERFLGKLHKVGYVGLKSPAYDSAIHADPSIIGDKRAMAIRGVTKLIESLDNRIGKLKRMALVNLVLQDVKWGFSNEELTKCIRELSEAMG